MIKNLKRILSWNIQGLNKETKQKLLADDFVDKNINFMLIQETKIQKNDQISITSSNNTRLTLYNSGHKSKSIKGVAILVRESTKLSFEAISERLCIAEIKLDNKTKIYAISVYAPTEDETGKYPEKTDEFYNKLSTVISKVSKRDILVVGGDFNARTKFQTDVEKEENSDIVGKYARNDINENGKHLIELCKIHNLKLVNTFYKHKPSQQVTWESSVKPKNNRKNPYRFQIDYIAIRKCSSLKLTDARSYNNMRANSDHKPVIATAILHTNISKPKSTPPRKILNIAALQNHEHQAEYQRKVKEKLSQQNQLEDTQEKWNSIVSATISAAEETVGLKSKHLEYKNDEIEKLSQQQKKLKQDIDSSKSPETKAALKIKRNRLLTKIHTAINNERTTKIDQMLEDIENTPDDSRRMFDVIKKLKRSKPKTKFLMKNQNGMLTSDEKEQVTIIAKYFQKLFFKKC